MKEDYRSFFYSAISVCLSRAGNFFPDIIFSDYLIYMPIVDGRYAFDDRECIILPMASRFTIDESLFFLTKGDSVADDVLISVYGVCDGLIVVEVDPRSFANNSGIFSLEDVFTVFAPDRTGVGSKDFLLRDVRFSKDSSDMILGNVFIGHNDENSIVRIANMAAASIASGCSYSAEFISSFYGLLQDYRSPSVVVSLIDLCAIAKFEDAFSVVMRYVKDSDKNIRESCYFALCVLGGERERKVIIESLRNEIDDSARFFLLRNALSKFSHDSLFIHQLLSGVVLSSKEKKLVDRQNAMPSGLNDRS